jgi:pimeloyl-ACP methyl ester carboxylesterase
MIGQSAMKPAKPPMPTRAELNARLGRYYAAPRTLVKIGARRRLNLLIAGEGEPTVIFAPGGWASTLEWALVQHPISAKTRTVAYDNAGFGFSDPGPLPRTASAIVNDLRAALKAADIPPPYVLAGWSFGGLIMRLFAFKYPRDVVGMVMVDSSSERQISLFAEDPKAIAWRRKLLRVERLARAGQLVAGTSEYDEFVVRDGAPKLPAAVKAARRAQRTSSGFYRAARSEYANLAAATLDEMNAVRRPLGDMPLIVLSAGKFFPTPHESVHPAEAWREAWRTGHDEIAALSTRGERRTIASGHAIQWEKPEAVVAAIEEVLAVARGG